MMNLLSHKVGDAQGAGCRYLSYPRSKSALGRGSKRLLWIGALAVGGLMMGWVPSLESTGGLRFSSQAVAQSKKPVTADHITKFVRSAIAVEPKRKQAVQEIQAVIGQVPAIRCDNRNSLNELDPSVRGIAINYCNESKRIVESNELSVERFNEILIEQRTNKALRDRIQGELCRLEPDLCR